MKWVGYEDMNTSVLGRFGTVLLEPEKENLLLLRSQMTKKLHCTPQPCSYVPGTEYTSPRIKADALNICWHSGRGICIPICRLVFLCN